MANEAVMRDRMSPPINMACVDGLAMEKGTVLAFIFTADAVRQTAKNDHWPQTHADRHRHR